MSLELLVSAFPGGALENTWAISWKPFTTVSGQPFSSRMLLNVNNPKTGPPPTDNGTITTDLIPYRP